MIFFYFIREGPGKLVICLGSNFSLYRPELAFADQWVKFSILLFVDRLSRFLTTKIRIDICLQILKSELSI